MTKDKPRRKTGIRWGARNATKKNGRGGHDVTKYVICFAKDPKELRHDLMAKAESVRENPGTCSPTAISKMGKIKGKG